MIYISVLISITQFEEKSFLKEKTRKKNAEIQGQGKNHEYHIAKYLFQPGVLRKPPFIFDHNLNS